MKGSTYHRSSAESPAHRTRVGAAPCLWLLALYGATAGSGQAQAHLFPAIAPEFAAGPCILRVDKTVTPELSIAYDVPRDDTEFDMEDIMLEDSKTHQFFALRGGVAEDGLLFHFFPFDAREGPTGMPIWITATDAKRAAAAKNGASLLPGLTEAEIPAEMTLERHEVLAPRFLRITADAARVPITKVQAAMGLTWDVRDVDPGVYTLAGYIFSPPANGWATSGTLVNLHDGGEVPPALVLGSVHTLLMGSQGVRVRGCLDAPAGSRLHLAYQWVEDLERVWHPAFTRDVPEGQTDLAECFVPPGGQSGSVRLRAELVTPDGRSVRAYSPDTVTVLASPASCETSDDVCCVEQGGSGQATGEPAGRPGTSVAGGGTTGSDAAADMPRRQPGGDAGATAAGTTTAGGAGGCHLGAGRAGAGPSTGLSAGSGTGGYGVLVIGLLLVGLGLPRRRTSRTP